MKRRLLLGCLLLTPVLAHAYPRNNEALAVLPYLTVLLLATPMLLVLTFWRPHERSFQIAQGVCLLCFAGLRLVGARFFNILGPAALPALDAILPLALLLNGLTLARLAQRPSTCRLGAGIAVAGSAALCGLLLHSVVHLSPLQERGGAALALLVALGGWVVVLCWLRRQPGPAAILWQPGGRVLVAATGACLGFLLFTFFSVVLPRSTNAQFWALLAGDGLQVAVACWLTGVLAFRLISPPATSISQATPSRAKASV